MEASLAMYRARIGLYATKIGRIRRSSFSSSSDVQCQRAWSVRLLPSLLLCSLLLLIGCVEPNPGPQHFKCHVCEKILTTVKSYFGHQSNHFTSKFPCPIRACSFNFTKLNTMQSHVSIYHKTQNPENTITCSVPFCNISFGRGTLAHLEEHLKLGQSVTCPVSDCATLHKEVKNFRAHMSRHSEPNISVRSSRSASSPNVPQQSGSAATRNVPQQSGSAATRNVPQQSGSAATRNVPQQSGSAATRNVPQESENVAPQGFPRNPSLSDPYSSYSVKQEILRFYMELEGIDIMPSSHVQLISEEIALLTDMSHHCLKRKLLKEMQRWNIDKKCIDNIIASTFTADPVYNVHHKLHDQECMTTTYLRKELMHKYYPYVSAIEIPLGNDSTGKPKLAHYVPPRETLEILLKDPKVKAKVKNSFEKSPRSDGIFEDYTDGSAFKNHQLQHENGKCIQLVFFQDAFEFSPFGPAKGLYKSIGMYYYLGNLPPEYRSKVDMIQLALLFQERHLKLPEAEFLQCKNGFQKPLDLLLKDLHDLRSNGLVIDGESYPVCFLFCTGDNLGSHQIGSFVQSFSAGHCCRYCPISLAKFKEEPHLCESLRTPEQYDNYVAIAKAQWESDLPKYIETQNQRRERAEREGDGASVKGGRVSINARKKLRSLNHLGVKAQPSVLNQIPGFHVASPALPPCLAHDFFEGVADLVLAKIFQHWIETKKWFSLETLNRRIKKFEYKGKDRADSPNAIHSFDGIKGHACETWTLLRLLPFIVHDLIQDKEDDYWLLYLKLKQICEFVCAPKISFRQVMYLNTLIQEYLCDLKKLLPSCLTSKAHFISHYPNLVLIFGPLIRLFTMRFESCHVFFKAVGKVCKNFKNITYTLANKYQYRFAYQHKNGVLPEDIQFVSSKPLNSLDSLPEDVRLVVPPVDVLIVNSVIIKSILYEPELWLVVDKANTNDLLFGQICKILYYSSEVHFVLRLYTAENSYSGYYRINSQPTSVCIKKLSDLPDYYPLPSYNVSGHNCISLKHSVICM